MNWNNTFNKLFYCMVNSLSLKTTALVSKSHAHDALRVVWAKWFLKMKSLCEIVICFFSSIGQIVDGMLVLKKIENVPTGANNRPKVPVLISQCGEMWSFRFFRTMRVRVGISHLPLYMLPALYIWNTYTFDPTLSFTIRAMFNWIPVVSKTCRNFYYLHTLNTSAAPWLFVRNSIVFILLWSTFLSYLHSSAVEQENLP